MTRIAPYPLAQRIRNGERLEGFEHIDDLPFFRLSTLTTRTPTVIEQSSGPLTVNVHAPTVLVAYLERISIDAYAPLLVLGPADGVDAYVRADTRIEDALGEVRIVASPDLELIARDVESFNGRRPWFGRVHIHPPERTRGTVYVHGGQVEFVYKKAPLNQERPGGLTQLSRAATRIGHAGANRTPPPGWPVVPL